MTRQVTYDSATDPKILKRKRSARMCRKFSMSVESEIRKNVFGGNYSQQRWSRHWWYSEMYSRAWMKRIIDRLCSYIMLNMVDSDHDVEVNILNHNEVYEKFNRDNYKMDEKVYSYATITFVAIDGVEYEVQLKIDIGGYFRDLGDLRFEYDVYVNKLNLEDE